MSGARDRVVRPSMAEAFMGMIREVNRQGVVLLVGDDSDMRLLGNVDGMDQELRELVLGSPSLVRQALTRLLAEDLSEDWPV